MKKVKRKPFVQLTINSKGYVEDMSKKQMHKDEKILTDDINNNNPNFRYDPVNMGTYNYFASLPINDDTTRIEIKINDYWHRKYDVSTFIKWGNVKGFMYGTTKDERDANGYYYNNYANKDVYENYWKGIFE